MSKKKNGSEVPAGFPSINVSTNADDVARVASLLKRISTEAGSHRTKIMEITRGLADEHAFSVPFGKGIGRVRGNGSLLDVAAKSGVEGPIAEMEYSTDRFWVNPKISSLCIPGSVPLNKTVDGMPVPCGVCVIIGASGVGKTVLAHRLASSGVDNYGVVRSGEPFAGYSVSHSVIAEHIGVATAHYSDVVVDSIKDLLAIGGAAMKGGVSRTALLELSAWSILGATLGTTFYVPLNPSNSDSEMIKLMTEVAISSSTMVMTPRGDGAEWNYIVRTGEGMPRHNGYFKLQRSEDHRREPSVVDHESVSVLNHNSSSYDEIVRGVLDRNRISQSHI